MNTLDRDRLKRLLAWSLGALVALVLVILGPPWFHALVPDWAQRRGVLGLLWTMLGAFIAGAVLAPLVALVSLALSIHVRRACGVVPRRLFAAFALGLSTCLALVLMEAGSLLYRWHIEALAPLPDPPGYVPDVLSGLDHEKDLNAPTPRECHIVVIGESSARGEPFDPNASVAHILAWQLHRVMPDREFIVDMKAQPGIRLDMALDYLRELKRKPDAVLLYSGHNEFQGRYSWSRTIEHYKHDPILARWSLRQRLAQFSPTCFLLDRAIEQRRLSFAPPKTVTRELVDQPTCSPAEYDEVVRFFERRLEHWLAYCKRNGILPLAVGPAGNDAGWPPCRSVLDPDATPEERAAFAEEFRAVQALEETDTAAAEAAYRDLINRKPMFAESHFRLARLLEARGQYTEADAHYVLARDLDGLPMRCPTRLLETYRRAAQARPELVFADGPAVLRRVSPTGLVGDEFIVDGQHPSLRGYAALAQDLLDQIASRGLLGWPKGQPPPRIDLAACARDLGIDQEAWALAARRAASFYDRTATVRFDPSESLFKSQRLLDAAQKIESGTPPDETGLPGLGARPLSREKY